MLAGTRSAGLEGLALLAGPLSRLTGVNRPLRDADDLRGILIAVHDSALAEDAVHALHSYSKPITATRTSLLYVDAISEPGPPEPWRTIPTQRPSDRYGGECDAQGAACARVGPWLATNATLWPRTAVLVGNPQRLRDLGARERAWVTEAAKQAATYSTTRNGDDARTLSELCAGGVRVTELPRAARHACAKRGGRSTAGWKPAPTRAQRCGRSGVYGPRRRRPCRCGRCPAARGRRRSATPRAACPRPCLTASTGCRSPTRICAPLAPTGPATERARRR